MSRGSDEAASRVSAGASAASPEPVPSDRIGALLTASLTEGPTRPLYSPAATFMSGFFGGAYGALLMMHLNSRRLRRQRVDAALELGLALGWTLLGYAIYRNLASFGLEGLLGGGVRPQSIVMRGAGLVMVGAAYARHRPFYRAMRMAGTRPPRGMLQWILACLLGAALEIGLVVLAQRP
jgi:hypothetical protein